MQLYLHARDGFTRSFHQDNNGNSQANDAIFFASISNSLCKFQSTLPLKSVAKTRFNSKTWYLVIEANGATLKDLAK